MSYEIEQLSKLFLKEASIKSTLLDRDSFILINDLLFGVKNKSDMFAILLRNDMFPKKVKENKYLLFKANGIIYRNVILDTYGGYFIRYENPIEVKRMYDSLKSTDFINRQEAHALWSDRVE